MPLLKRIFRKARFSLGMLKPKEKKALLRRYNTLVKTMRWQCEPPICKRVKFDTIKSTYEVSRLLRRAGYKNEANEALNLAVEGAIGEWIHVRRLNLPEPFEDLNKEAFLKLVLYGTPYSSATKPEMWPPLEKW